MKKKILFVVLLLLFLLPMVSMGKSREQDSILILPTDNYVESAITETQLYNVSYVNITYGAFGSNFLDWVVILGIGLPLGYVFVYGAGPYNGIPAIQKTFKKSKDWMLDIIEGTSRARRRSGIKSKFRSSESKSGFGKFKVKMPDKWPKNKGWTKPKSKKGKKR